MTNYHKLEMGYVSNEENAVLIAEKIWLDIYGKTIYKQKPYETKLDNGVWYINGSLHQPPVESEMIRVGGVAYIEIVQKTGRILNVSHSR